MVIGTDCTGSCISNYIRSRPQWPLVCLSIASTIAFVYCSFTPLSPCFCYIVAEWWMKREYIHTWIFMHFLLTDKVKELAMTQQIACIFACDSRIMAGMGIWWDMLLHQPVGKFNCTVKPVLRNLSYRRPPSFVRPLKNATTLLFSE